jgi:C-mannosyltransferase DPY19L
LGPVESCEGLGNLHYFYIYGVFFCAGLVIAAIFIGGFLLSESYFGGVLAASAFMFNHGSDFNSLHQIG